MAADLPLLDGPRIAPRSGTAKQLVVFLHGYGADGNDLIDIGHAWRQWLPDAAFVSPDAPEPCAEAPMGRQWFSIDRSDPRGRWKGVTSVAPVVHRFLDEELKRHDLPPTALALVGFSQGTMIGLHVGLRRTTPPLAIVGYSGRLTAPNQTRLRGHEERDHQPAAGAADPRRHGHGGAARFARIIGTGPEDSRHRRGNPHVARHRPRHRSGRTAARRRVSRARLRGAQPR